MEFYQNLTRSLTNAISISLSALAQCMLSRGRGDKEAMGPNSDYLKFTDTYLLLQSKNAA